MLRLIASDLDGTLLLNGAQSLTPRAKEQAARLIKRGILFTAASGRQYPNLVRLFGEELSKQMAFICENGAYVVYKGEELACAPIERGLGLEIMRDICQIEDCEVLLSGKNTSYLQPKTEAYVRHLRDTVKNNVTVVSDIAQVEEPFLKISIYRKEGIHAVEEHFHAAFGQRAKVVASDFLWLDITATGVNKGAALKEIQARLKISPEETMVFGDNYNDVEMFARAGESYAMEGAAAEVKAYAGAEISCVEDVFDRLLEKSEKIF